MNSKYFPFSCMQSHLHLEQVQANDLIYLDPTEQAEVRSSNIYVGSYQMNLLILFP